MADFDLKILFGVDIKDSDFNKVNQELEKIQEQAKKLQESLTTSPNQQSLWDNFTQFNKVSETIGHIKRLGQSIEELTKQQNNLSNLAKQLGDVGKTIQQSFDDGKLNLLKRYKEELEKLQTLATQSAVQSDLARTMAERAASMGNVQAAARYSRLATMRGLEAGQAIAAAHQIGATMGEPSMAGGGAGNIPPIPPSGSAGDASSGGGMGPEILAASIAALARGSLAPIMSLMGRMAPLATAFGIAYNIPTVIRGLDRARLMPERGEAAGIQFSVQTAESAAQGQVFDLLSLRSGVTTAGQLRDRFFGSPIMGSPSERTNALIRELGHGGFGGGFTNISQTLYEVGNILRLRSPGESLVERFQALNQVDRERFGWIINRGGQELLNIIDNMPDVAQEFGLQRTVSMFRGGFRAGVSRTFMAPLLQTIQAQGLDVGLAEQPELMTDAFRLGLSPGAMQQMLRVGHFRQTMGRVLSINQTDSGLTAQELTPVGEFANLIRGAGLSRLASVRAFTDSVAANVAAQAGIPDIMGGGEVFARTVGAFVQPGSPVPEPTLVKSGLALGATMQQNIAQSFNLSSLSMEMALVEMGIDSPMVRLQLRRVMANNPAAAARIIERLTDGRITSNEAQKIIGQTMALPTQITEGLFTEKEKAAFGAEKIALAPSFQVGQLLTGDAETGRRVIENLSNLGSALPKRAETPSFGSDIVSLEQARAKQELGVTQALEDMGEAIFKAIQEGFIAIGQQIAEISTRQDYQRLKKTTNTIQPIEGTPKNR